MGDNHRPLRVVICDDVAEIRMLVGLALSQDSGLEVIGEACDGQDCVEKVRELQPDIVLLDLNMPVMGGLEALPLIARACPDASIVAFSGFEGRILAQLALDQGAHGYIEKGTSVPELVSRLKDIATA
jgi:DNA-binding NarL/FixJ family response regulator